MRKYLKSQYTFNSFNSLNLVIVLVTTGILVSINFSFENIYAQSNFGKPSLYFVSTPDTQCPENLTVGPTYTDENGCIQPCPVDPQLVIPEECTAQQPSTSTEQLSQEELSAGDEESQEQQQPSTSTEQLSQEELSAGDEESQEQQQPMQLQEDNTTLSETIQPSNQTLTFTGTADTFTNITATNNPLGLIERNKPFVDLLAPSKCSQDITGRWTANDGGTYFIKQIGTSGPSKIWWFGSNTFREGDGFSNIFSGDRNGLRVTGQWHDVPMGVARGSGTMTLDIDPVGNKISKTSAGGDGFGGTEWTKRCIKDIGMPRTFSQGLVNATVANDNTVDYGGMAGSPRNDVIVK